MTDLLLVNGVIHTQDPSRPRARSIACAGGMIESLDETPAARRTIDLRGRTVAPGFIDAHVHLLALGRQKLELDLAGVTTVEELVRRVRERAQSAPAGSWITGGGYDLPGHPHHGALSEAAPDHPVWLLRKDGHSGLANARAMALADLASAPLGGEILRDQGVFLESAMQVMERAVPREQDAAAFLAAQKEAIPLGITGAHDAAVNDDYLRLLRSLDEGRSLRLRIHAMVHHADSARVVDFMRSCRPLSGRLSVRAVKLFMDGSLGSGTCWMLEPPQGMALLSAAEVERVGRAALDTGYQMCVHAIGDAANRKLLDAYERLDPPESARWRVEHAQHVAVADFPRMGRWIASVQPSHAVADRRMAVERLGPSRLSGSYAWRKLGRLALGTDAPVEKLDPRWTFYCAVTREGWEPSQSLTPEEALRGMTADAAWAGFMEGGVLAPGRPADMAVLSHDWLAVPPREVLSSEILATIMDGRVAHMSKNFSGGP